MSGGPGTAVSRGDGGKRRAVSGPGGGANEAREGLRHDWDLSPREAAALQEKLRGRVVSGDRFEGPRTVAGADVHFPRGSGEAGAAVALLSFPDLEPHEEATARRPASFPYVPGLLSFREIPPVLDALGRLRAPPDLLLCDGHGYAHPRRFGLACHLGVLTGIPTIGVAKSVLVGEHDALPREKGARRPLVDRGEVVGAAVRTRTGVRPVYVSVGHRVSLETAIELVLGCTGRYRLPEPCRRAHRLAAAA